MTAFDSLLAELIVAPIVCGGLKLMFCEYALVAIIKSARIIGSVVFVVVFFIVFLLIFFLCRIGLERKCPALRSVGVAKRVSRFTETGRE